MNPIKTFAVMLCVAMLWTFGVWAQKWNRCDPRWCFITPANCTT